MPLDTVMELLNFTKESHLTSVALSGGEALLYPHIRKVLEKCKKLEFDCIPDEVLNEIMPEDFTAKKDMLTHRHMYNDEPLGEWDYETDHWRFKYGKEWEPGYESRLFGNMKDVTLRYYYLFFRHFANMNMKKECEKIGLEYTKNIFF